MIKLLSKIFIKNPNDYKNEESRTSYGVLCGAFGIFLNIILFGIKFLAGFLSGSIAITADAFNNLSDAGSSVITLVGFKMAGQEPDLDHPFGHGRIEYISGLLVSVIIIIMAYELFTSSFDKIIHPVDVEANATVFIILGISIVVKIYMAYYNRSIGKKIDSTAMMATATDSLSDTVATSVVLLATVISYFTGLKIDGYLGLLVSIFVFLAGFNAAKDTIGPLLGQPPSREFIAKIEEVVMSYSDKGVVGIHDLVVHDYGPGRVFLSVHVEVPSNRDILEMHDMIDLIEHDLRLKLNCMAVIHMDPVCVGDPETDELKSYVSEAVEAINKKYTDATITFHDFRMVKGPTHTNLIFDVVIPFEYKAEDSEVVNFIREYVNKKNNMLFCAINVDKAYHGRL